MQLDALMDSKVDNDDDESLEDEDFSALFEKWGVENPVPVKLDSELLNDPDYGAKCNAKRGIIHNRDDDELQHECKTTDSKGGFAWPPSPSSNEWFDTVDSVRDSWDQLLETSLKFGKPLQSVPIDEIEGEFTTYGVDKKMLDSTRERMAGLVGRDERRAHQSVRRPTIKQNVPDAELFAIGAYTEKYAFSALNKSLWENQAHKQFPGFSKTLIRALRHLPYVWKTPLYHGGMRTPDLDALTEGDLVTWKGFMSTSRRKEVAQLFINAKPVDEMCIYNITAWSGRDICSYSQYRYEKEVLIPPYSLFQITKRTRDKGVLVIDMEEMAIWRGSRCVLWVDDQPENNKTIMEKAELTGSNFVMAKTTHEAMAFVEFEAHVDLLKRHSKKLRVITDMTREEDSEWIEDAGCRLITRLIDHGYHEKVMVYVNDKAKAIKKLEKHNLGPEHYIITRDFNEVYKFCTFGVESHLGTGNPVIFVNVSAGRNLAAKDFFGTSDPYCVIELFSGDRLVSDPESPMKTNVVKKALNPVFKKSEFKFVLSDPYGTLVQALKMKITVYDKDKYTPDDYMGHLEFDFTEVQAARLSWFPLKKRKKRDKVSGELQVEYWMVIPDF